jgi:tRNA dimethylallyltransferase
MNRLIALVGPTATGKSSLATDLAEAVGGEIVSADAMSLYRGMDIGTAKTPADQRRGIPHHQIDVLDVTQEASVAAYQRNARADIEQIWARGKPAIMVGGSGLYVRAALDVIDFPGTDPAVRDKWEDFAERNGPDAAHRELAQRDPAAAQVIGPANLRRIVRALEVIELTGAPFTARLPSHQSWRPVDLFGLDLPNLDLDQMIAQRTESMMAAGLVAETAALVDQGLRQGRTAARAIGYREAIAVLDGELEEAEASDAIGLATRQLARRQRKWFRRDPRVTWLKADQGGLVDAVMHAVQSRPGGEG